MNDRQKRESLVAFANQNGLKLHKDFRDGDGTFRGSDAVKGLAKEIYGAMDNVIEAFMASGDKGTAQKNLAELSEYICMLDKDGQRNRFQIQGKFEQMSAKIKTPDPAKNDKNAICSFIRQTINHMPYYIQRAENGMTPELGGRIVKALEDSLNVIETQVVDGYSLKANNAAIGVANTLINIRNDVSTGMTSTFNVADFEQEMKELMQEWTAIKSAPSPKEIAPDDYKVRLNHNDTFSALCKIPEIKNLAQTFFGILDRNDPSHRYNEITSKIQDIINQNNNLNADNANQVSLLDNGRITKEQALANIKANKAKQEMLTKEYNKYLGQQNNLKAEMEANEKFRGSMDVIKDKYEYYAEGTQYPIFAQLFSPTEFDYNGLVRMMSTNPTPATMMKVRETIHAFASNLAQREEAIAEQNKMFEEIYERQKSRNSDSILDKIPESMMGHKQEAIPTGIPSGNGTVISDDDLLNSIRAGGGGIPSAQEVPLQENKLESIGDELLFTNFGGDN